MIFSILRVLNLKCSWANGEISILESVICAFPNEGRITNIKTTMPIPPIKCIEERQNSNPFGRASILLRIVAPVVVYPETLSNNAFTSVNSPPQSNRGNIPMKQEIIQLNTTTK